MSREAMQMALDMLNEIADYVYCDQKLEGVITALRQALDVNMSEERVDVTVKSEHEPVAWANSFDLQNFDMKVRTGPDLHHTVPLYTAPPKRELTCVCGAVWEGETMVHPPREREWVGLTDDEIHDMNGYEEDRRMYRFARAIEAKLREKNA